MAFWPMSVHWIFFLNHPQFFSFSFLHYVLALIFGYNLQLESHTHTSTNELTYGILLESIFFALSVVNKMDDCKLNEPNQRETIFTQQQTIQPFHQISSMKWSSRSCSHHMTWYDTVDFFSLLPHTNTVKNTVCLIYGRLYFIYSLTQYII